MFYATTGGLVPAAGWRYYTHPACPVCGDSAVCLPKTIMDQASENSEDIAALIAELRQKRSLLAGRSPAAHQRRVVRAFAAFAHYWKEMLQDGKLPLSGDLPAFPTVQIEFSLRGLLPGFAEAGSWLSRTAANTGTPTGKGGVAALVLAGNTPLLSWQPLAAALLAGYAVFVKESRDESFWVRQFIHALSSVDEELASLIKIARWPKESLHTRTLLSLSDTVIAYGSDSAIASLQQITPSETPFFGYGHAISIGLVLEDGAEEAARFASDILLYNQQGCLSAQAILVVGEREDIQVQTTANLAHALEKQTAILDIPPVSDPAVAMSVRRIRDMALFSEDIQVIGDTHLRWTILNRSRPEPLSMPPGHGIVSLTPVRSLVDDFGAALGEMRGHISSVGIAGTLSPEYQAILQREGISRICPAGKMQSPPLDWRNGNRDLLEELLKSGRRA